MGNLAEPNNLLFLERISTLPILEKSWCQISSLYSTIKERNRFLCSALNHAEGGVKLLARQAAPLASKWEKPIGQMDSYACDKLTALEQRYPIIRQPADQVIEAAKSNRLLGRLFSSKEMELKMCDESASTEHSEETDSNKEVRKSMAVCNTSRAKGSRLHHSASYLTYCAQNAVAMNKLVWKRFCDWYNVAVATYLSQSLEKVCQMKNRTRTMLQSAAVAAPQLYTNYVTTVVTTTVMTANEVWDKSTANIKDVVGTVLSLPSLTIDLDIGDLYFEEALMLEEESSNGHVTSFESSYVPYQQQSS